METFPANKSYFRKTFLERWEKRFLPQTFPQLSLSPLLSPALQGTRAHTHIPPTAAASHARLNHSGPNFCHTFTEEDKPVGKDGRLKLYFFEKFLNLSFPNFFCSLLEL